MRILLATCVAVCAFAPTAAATHPTLTFTVQHGAKLYVCNRWTYSSGWIDRCVRVWSPKASTA